MTQNSLFGAGELFERRVLSHQSDLPHSALPPEVSRHFPSNVRDHTTFRVPALPVLINWWIGWRYLITISDLSYVNYARVYILRLPVNVDMATREVAGFLAHRFKTIHTITVTMTTPVSGCGC